MKEENCSEVAHVLDLFFIKTENDILTLLFRIIIRIRQIRIYFEIHDISMWKSIFAESKNKDIILF